MLYRSFIEPGAIGRCPIGGYCLLSLDQIPPGLGRAPPARARRRREPFRGVGRRLGSSEGAAFSSTKPARSTAGDVLRGALGYNSLRLSGRVAPCVAPRLQLTTAGY